MWTNKIPTVVTLPYHIQQSSSPEAAAWYEYVERQRWPLQRLGARSLKDCAAEKSLSILSDGDELPWTVAIHVWELATKSVSLTFQSWKVLSRLLRDHNNATFDVFRFHQVIHKPGPDLSTYIKPLNSRKFEFITALRISANFSVRQIIDIWHLSNIGVLEMACDGSTSSKDTLNISDRLIRTWADQAAKGEGFQVLRVLKLSNFKEISSVSTDYITLFPALAAYHVSGCAVNKNKCAFQQAEACGWRVLENQSLTRILSTTNSKSVKRDLTAMEIQSSLQITPCPYKCVWPAGVVRMADRKHEQPTTEEVELSKSDYFDGYKLRDMPASLQKSLEKAQVDREWTVIQWNLFKLHMDEFEESWRLDLNDNTAYQEKSRRSDIDEISWGFERFCHFIFSCIGELRDDEDLKLAGVPGLNTCNSMGNDVITSVPMACIELGPSISSAELKHHTGGEDFLFFRLRCLSLPKFDSENLAKKIPQTSRLLRKPKSEHQNIFSSFLS